MAQSQPASLQPARADYGQGTSEQSLLRLGSPSTSLSRFLSDTSYSEKQRHQEQTTLLSLHLTWADPQKALFSDIGNSPLVGEVAREGKLVISFV